MSTPRRPPSDHRSRTAAAVPSDTADPPSPDVVAPVRPVAPVAAATPDRAVAPVAPVTPDRAGGAPDLPTTLIVLAKAPVPGRVKTRLCPPCSPGQAAAIAEAALIDTLDAAIASRADRVVLALDGRPGRWCPPSVEVVGQGSGSLDRRLTTAWTAATNGPALLVGMDTPQVTADELDEALDLLGVHDSVLGPADDGGWWTLGLRRPHPRAFVGVPMSRSDTGRHQRDRLAALGLRPATLATRTDVDTWADALAVAHALPGGRFARAVGAVADVADVEAGARFPCSVEAAAHRAGAAR